MAGDGGGRHGVTRPHRPWAFALVAVLVVGAAVVVVRALVAGDAGPPRCNGYAALCRRRYDEVTYAGAHNAMASADRHFFSVMQDLTITGQLESGVRALLVDAHYWPSPTATGPGAGADAELLSGPVRTPTGAWWCHMTCTLGAERLAAGFREVRNFVGHHPNEVVTIIIEDYVTRADVAAGVRRAGLLPYVYTPPADPHSRWPTLRTMINRNRRVVIFSERSRALTSPRWYRNFYRFGMETPFKDSSVAQVADDCRPNRGGVGKRLFLLNNFMSAANGNRGVATTMNDERFVLRRAEQCTRVRGHRVNIVAANFTDRGDLMNAVAVLNGVRKPPA
jgi:hypothetical protein